MYVHIYIYIYVHTCIYILRARVLFNEGHTHSTFACCLHLSYRSAHRIETAVQSTHHMGNHSSITTCQTQVSHVANYIVLVIGAPVFLAWTGIFPSRCGHAKSNHDTATPLLAFAPPTSLVRSGPLPFVLLYHSLLECVACWRCMRLFNLNASMAAYQVPRGRLVNFTSAHGLGIHCLHALLRPAARRAI